MSSDPRKIRVLLLCQRAESWVNVAGLWRAMQSDPRFSGHVCLLPYNYADPEARGANEKAAQVLDADGVDYSEWARDGIMPAPGQYDIAVFNAPYDRERPPEFHFDVIRRKVARTVYLPYGLVTGAGEKNLSYQYAQPTQILADSIIARSHFEKALYARYCPSGDRHVHVLGLPRLDALHDIARFPTDPELASAIGDRFAVLWNSHFSFGLSHANGLCYSTFDSLAEPLFAYALREPGIALVWRPHPGLFPVIKAELQFGNEQLLALRAELLRAGIALDERSDHRHAFAASDALMTDAGSFLVEYLATGKPMLYLHNPVGEELNEEAARIASHCATASSPSQAIRFVASIRSGDDPRTAKRRGLTAVHLPGLDGRTCQRVLEHFADLAAGHPTCDLPAPTHASALATAWPLIDSDEAQPYYTIDAVQYPTIALLCSRLRELRAEKQRRTRAVGTLAWRITRARNRLTEGLKRRPALMRLALRLRCRP
ncbi:hypothetical protein [Luteimonas cucumeris]|nr:hypothetical protein [Luteimonas cucumeris]